MVRVEREKTGMRLLETITEDEMAAVFLKTEINSTRFSADIMSLLRRDGMSRRIIDTPDTRNQEENAYRISCLVIFVGTSKGAPCFRLFLTRFPGTAPFSAARKSPASDTSITPTGMNSPGALASPLTRR